MTLRIFLAGATGVIGRSLVPLLRSAGHSVIGTTRHQGRTAELEELGADAVVVDVFDADRLNEAVANAAPDVLIHQLTDLSGGIDAASPDEGIRRNARLRRVGTAHLVQAALAAGVRRFIGQSIGWAYAPKPPPFVETDPLDLEAAGPRAITVSEGVAPLEAAILGQTAFEGLILRYGQLYGPGTWSPEPVGAAPLHVDAAAYAARLAVDRGQPGAYNVADAGGALAIGKAMSELGWRPDFRLVR